MKTINEMRKIILDLDEALSRLRHEAMNLPFSDFRYVLLTYVEAAMCWETVRDLKAIRETMLMAPGMIDREDLKPHVVAELKKRVEKVREMVDKILCQQLE